MTNNSTTEWVRVPSIIIIIIICIIIIISSSSSSSSSISIYLDCGQLSASSACAITVHSVVAASGELHGKGRCGVFAGKTV